MVAVASRLTFGKGSAAAKQRGCWAGEDKRINIGAAARLRISGWPTEVSGKV
jgi:hypothetical protein